MSKSIKFSFKNKKKYEEKEIRKTLLLNEGRKQGAFVKETNKTLWDQGKRKEKKNLH